MFNLFQNPFAKNAVREQDGSGLRCGYREYGPKDTTQAHTSKVKITRFQILNLI